MIDNRENERVIVRGLGKYLAAQAALERPCLVVRQKQNAPAPPYPFVCYTVAAPVEEAGGTWHEADGRMWQPVTQKWRFVAQSDDEDEALRVIYAVREWFVVAGVTDPLGDAGLVVRQADLVESKDELVEVAWEYRKELEVTLAMNDCIPYSRDKFSGAIVTVELKPQAEG